MPSTTKTADQPRTTLTIDQMCLSPFNVRSDANATSPEAIAIMERSLLGQGQLEPILVHPMRGNAKKWGSHAGGRRYRAFKNLIERGELPREHPIAVVVRDGRSDAELIEESMAENIGRRDLEPYETFAGVRRANALGHSVERIAENLGQSADAIERMLRLGTLAKPIFDALAAGAISTEQACAFGATGDTDVQLAAWERLKAGVTSFTHAPDRIRAAIGIGDHETAKLLTFVGEAAYLAAGGRLEPDLFAGPAGRDRIVDPGKLRELADAMLEVLRGDVRRRTGRADLRFVAQPPQSMSTTDWQLQVHPREGDKGAVELPIGEIVARVFVDPQGKAGVDYWWASRSAKYASNRGPAAANVSERTVQAVTKAQELADDGAIAGTNPYGRQIADAAIREEEGLSAESVQILWAQRRMILRAMLIDSAKEGGSAGADYLVWTQLRMAMDMNAARRPSKLGVLHKVGGDGDPEAAREYVAALPAAEVWRKALDELRRQTFITGEDLPDAFADYCASSQRLKDLATAIVAGWALERSLAADGYIIPLHDELARQCGVALFDHDEFVRRYWTPTEQLLARIPTRQALAIAEPFIEPHSWPAWTKAKAGEIARRLAALFTGEPVRGLRADRAQAAEEWVHPLLRFDATRGVPEEFIPVSTKIEEAA